MSDVNQNDSVNSNEIFLYCDGLIDHGDVGPLFYVASPSYDAGDVFSFDCWAGIENFESNVMETLDDFHDVLSCASEIQSDDSVSLEVPLVPTDGDIFIDAIEEHR